MANNEKYDEMLLKMQNMLDSSPWVMRITETNKLGLTLQIFERQRQDNGEFTLHKYGEIGGAKLRCCKAPIRYILSEVLDELENPLGLQALLGEKVTYRGDVPLDKAAGVKLALITILNSMINFEAKAELIAWRIERVSAEEAFYWLGKVTVPVYGDKSMQWAIIGMRTMLAGPTDQKVNYDEMLEKLRR